ncbi:MAG: hypothetical protein OQJ78_02430 [Ignavibacteriaceae bacterium]|jgi:hypothetical protein|nr:hypothetical protein [Ignavibacteriaceae bacterium]
MNSGQSIISIAGIILISLLSLNVNQDIIQKSQLINSNEVLIGASSVAQAVIEEIQLKAFDENTIHKCTKYESNLCAPHHLGPDYGEYSHNQFDDIDDYNNYSTSVELEHLGRYDISVKVNYKINMHTDQMSSTQTFVKEIAVEVDNFSLPNPVKFYQIIGY